MTTNPTSAAPRLLPEELLTLAGNHEHAELERYRDLAFRFLAFSSAASRLMAALGIECEMRLSVLARAARRLGLEEPRTDGAVRIGAPVAGAPGLITSQAMARAALSRAMTEADASQRLYTRLGRLGAGSSLGQEFTAFARQKQTELAILREHCLDGDTGKLARRSA